MDSPTVLCIDDRPKVLELRKATLESHDYCVKFASCGFTATKVLEVFREGIRRGYEDGFNSRYQYGRYSNGKYTILGAILGSILDFRSLR